MAKSLLKAKTIPVDNRGYGEANLYLYPNFSEKVPEIDAGDREKLIKLFNSEYFIQFQRSVFLSGIARSIENDENFIFRVSYDLWESISLKAFEHLSIEYSEYIGRIPVSEIPSFYILVLNEPWIIDGLLKEICVIPSGVDRISVDRFQRLYCDALRSYARLDAVWQTPVPYQTLFKYLKSVSKAHDWQWLRYSRNAMSRDLHIVARTYHRGDASLHLIGLSNEIADKINSGYYKNISDEEFSKIGDHFSSCWSYDVSESLMRVSKDVALKSNFIFEYNYGIPKEDRINIFDIQNLIYFLKLNSSDFGIEEYYDISADTIDKSSVISSKHTKSDVIELLDLYARQHPGEPIGDIAFEGFQNAKDLEVNERKLGAWVDRIDRKTTTSIIPSAAPVSWSISNRLTVTDEKGPRRETAPEFIRRVYGEFLGKGMSRADLRRLDPALSKELDRYRKEHGLPDDLARDMPTMAYGETTGEDLERWRTGKNADGSEATFTKAEAHRLQSALQRAAKQK